MTENILPEYENPPLIEVVCSATFKEIPALTAAHIGIFWQSLQPDFPQIQELQPLDPTIEIFDTVESKFEIGFPSAPQMPREMFYSRDGNRIIQVQRDRFIYNWRKIKPEDNYPRFAEVYESFIKRYEHFQELLDGTPNKVEPIQYELSYINKIPQSEFGNNIKDIEKLLPAFNLKLDDKEILKKPENFDFRINFVLPNKIGRLYFVARSGLFDKNKLPVVLVEMRVRGMAVDSSDEARDDWFQTSREWIVKGFAEMTSKEVQDRKWRRKQ